MPMDIITRMLNTEYIALCWRGHACSCCHDHLTMGFLRRSTVPDQRRYPGVPTDSKLRLLRITLLDLIIRWPTGAAIILRIFGMWLWVFER